MNPFVWLRRMARNAVVAGVEDALHEMAPELESMKRSAGLLAPEAYEGLTDEKEEPAAVADSPRSNKKRN